MAGKTTKKKNPTGKNKTHKSETNPTFFQNVVTMGEAKSHIYGKGGGMSDHTKARAAG